MAVGVSRSTRSLDRSQNVPLEFTADMFEAVEEEWGLVTRLDGPSTEEEDFYLMLQRANEFDEQDIALGMDKPYIEFCGQG